jgi:RNA polymerase sigma-70 factor (ECF subfamily)
MSAVHIEPAAMVPPDADLVEQVRRGDRTRFELLMRRHNRRVYRAVRSFLTDDAEVEDVMQQAYLRAFLHLHQLVDGTKVASWLVRIAVNQARSRLRQRRRLAEDELDAENEDGHPMAASWTPEEELADRELAAIVERALVELREIYRAVFVLREVEGMTTRETGVVLGVSPAVVKTRLSRAKQLLRRRLLVRAGRTLGDVFAFAAPRCDRVVAGTLARIRERANH